MRLGAWRANALGIGLALVGRETALAQPVPARALLFDEAITESPGMVVNGILVNGHPFFSSVPGQTGGAHVCNEASGGCVAGASAWADLDEAEAAFPGEFRGQPLEIEVQGRAETTHPTRRSASRSSASW